MPFEFITATICPFTVDWSKENERFRNRVRFLRLFLFIIYTVLYVCTMTYESSNFLTAPVAHSARGMFFPGPETNLEDIISQEFSKSMEKHMSASVITSFLQTLQFKCKDQAFQEGDEALDFFQCELVDISFSGLQRNNRHWIIPCTDTDQMNAIVKEGDLQPYDENPKILVALYEENYIEAQSQVTPKYSIHQRFPLFAPLFTTDEDKAASQLGPLPTMNNKLNSIARYLGISFDGAFANNRDLKQSSSAPLAPAPGSTDPVERNHHWDTLMRCDPEDVQVTFKLSTRENASPLPLWWTFTFQFRRHGERLGMYRGHLEINTSQFYHENAAIEAVLPLATLFFFLVLLLPYGVTAILLAPYYFMRLVQKKGHFRKLIYSIFDPSGYRIPYTSLFKVAMEDLGCVFTVLGFAVSLWDIFMSKGSAYYVEELDSLLSPFMYWRHKNLSRSTFITNFLFALWSANTIHALATIFYIVRLLEFSFAFAGTNYILMTFLFAFFPVLHFSVVFFMVILAFSLLAHSFFGNVFPQYSTLSGSVWALILYAFSFAEQANNEDLLHPMVEKDAHGLQILHLMFMIVVVVIMLNMFTTIILDAYQIALDRCSSRNKMLRLEAAAWYRFKHAFGYYEELDEEIQILGGRPGRVFLRATVAREHPLDIEKTRPRLDTVYSRLTDALAALEKAKPAIVRLEQQEKRRRGGTKMPRVYKPQLPQITEDEDEDSSGSSSCKEPNEADEREPLLDTRKK